jgi:bleomycin hydrolase
MYAIIKNGINSVAIDYKSSIAVQYSFSDEIETGKVTNQKQSGRCWRFAGLNVLRHKMAKQYNPKTFELSQNYQMSWDKFEKANYFLESIIDTAKEDVDSRIVMWLLSTLQQDGGQWDMFANLVKKYGVVPKNIMPETYHSSQTGPMNYLLNLKLRKDASVLRNLSAEGASEEEFNVKKEEMLNEIYCLLCNFLGELPKLFDFEYRNERKKFSEIIH